MTTRQYKDCIERAKLLWNKLVFLATEGAPAVLRKSCLLKANLNTLSFQQLNFQVFSTFYTMNPHVHKEVMDDVVMKCCTTQKSAG